MLFSFSDLKVALRPKKSDDVILRRLIFKQSATLLKIACRSTAIYFEKNCCCRKYEYERVDLFGAHFYMLNERYAAKKV